MMAIESTYLPEIAAGTGIDEGGEFEIKTAAEWLDEAECAESCELFGDLWREGEISVLFGDTSSGKSLLAVQIAESIARGEAVEPFEMTAEAQKVLLLDLGGTAKQFVRRYTAESDEDDEGKAGGVKRYEFSPNLIRVSLKGSVQTAASKLAPLIEQTGARVVIIDSLAFLQRYSLPRETVVVMRELRRLQRAFGLSIMVLMNTARAVYRRGIIAGDLPCASVVTSFVDNIFAVGRSGSQPGVRYLKHIKGSVDDGSYEAAHVPCFAIMRVGGNFQSFCHFGFASESSVRAGDDDHWEWQRIRLIKNHADRGFTIRAIADHLGLTRTTVHRLLKMAGDAPPLPSPAAFHGEQVLKFYALEKCIVERCTGCGECKGRAATDFKGVPGTIILGHGKCPDDCDMCGPRRYRTDDSRVDQKLRTLSENHYEALRNWLLGGKKDPKPVYPGARRYGVLEAFWKPGSENWTEEQIEIYRDWRRTHWMTNRPEPDFNTRAGP